MTDPIPVLCVRTRCGGADLLAKRNSRSEWTPGSHWSYRTNGSSRGYRPLSFAHGGQDGDLLTSNGAGGYDWEDHNKWQSFEVLPPFELEWSGEPTDKLYYNSFACVMTLSLYKGGAHPENTIDQGHRSWIDPCSYLSSSRSL